MTSQSFFSKNLSSHLLLLSGWMLLGLVLRLTNLAAKPPWSDEWATIVFSLGHSFRTIPLNTLISLNDLLQPLVVEQSTQPQDVIEHLMGESTHPPLYFLLSHWWLQLLGSDRLVSIWWARSLSSLLGVAAIPGMYFLSWLWFRQRIFAQLAAALMAVSPYGVYLSQEARHYTLAILWVIASVACLNLAVRSVLARTKPPLWLIALWIMVNCLGLATHYFFALTLVAEVMVLFTYWLRCWHRSLAVYWLRIYLAIAGTISGSLVWVVNWQGITDNQLTSWVFAGNPLAEFFDPLLRLLVWWITMFGLLPVEGVASWVGIVSGLIVLSCLGWTIAQIWQRWQTKNQSQLNLQGIEVLWRSWLSAIALILAITYIFGADLTLSARFQFIYFPIVLLLVAALLGGLWQSQGKRTVVVTLFLGFLGALTIVNNFAYQKVERPELVVSEIVAAQNNLKTPIIIATLHQTHGQTGEMMSLAWQFRQFLPLQPQFFLAHTDRDNPQPTQSLLDAISEVPRPFQLWLVNFFPSENLALQSCTTQDRTNRRATGYVYQLYTCLLGE
ncbi:glycosyltransferase [Pleurocapsales cyanobacterium LEGE 10410]|nr:glycosyltransferase [Pleurocapsales cyanobacterium LEGE 10410]